MDAQTFLSFHNQGLGRLLGISFTNATPQLVEAQLKVENSLCSQPDTVHGGAIMTLADCASAYGAVLNLPAGSSTATIESKSNLYKKGTGPTVRASSIPLHVGRTMSVWRCSVFRGEEQIAEVTQTQIILRKDDVETAADAAPAIVLSPTGMPMSEEPATQARRTETSRNFSNFVVDERWHQIFEGACAVITEKGFAKATIREIAAAAGMPVPTMYQYLERKEDLLARIYEYFMTDIVTAMNQWRVSKAPPRERITGVIHTMIDWFDRRHKYIKLMFQETRALTPAARQRVYELDAQYIKILREILDTALLDRGDRKVNTELFANFIYFLCCIWPLRHWTIGNFGEERVSNEIVEFVLNGIGPLLREETR